MPAALVQVNVSRGGMPKKPVDGALLSADGVQGDWQNDRRFHGGPNKAVCLFSAELYDWLGAQGIDLKYGSVGENLTTREVDLVSLSPGDRLRVGPCLIEITTVRVPCHNLDMWDPRLMKLMKGRSGWYAKVIEGGAVAPGDEIEVIWKRARGQGQAAREPSPLNQP